MGDLTKNLSRYECACKCGCGFDTVDLQTAGVLQDCCNYYSKLLGHKVTMIVTSLCRCAYWNEFEGGAQDSKHLQGRAVDFYIRGVPAGSVYAYLDQKYIGRFGLGYHAGFTHLDTRSGEGVRW